MTWRTRNAVPAQASSRPGELSSDLALYQAGRLRPLQLYERLTGPRRTWWKYCQEAARGTVPVLGEEELNPAFEVVSRQEPAQSAGAVTDGVRAVCAVSRALALEGDGNGDQRSLVSEAASRWRNGPAAPTPAHGPPFSAAAALAQVPLRFQDRTRSVLSLLDQPQHDAGEAMVAICALMLVGAQPSTRSTVEVRVVLAVRREGRVDGVTGRLKVRELPGGPAGLFPDPEALIVQPTNEAFDRALRLAWRFSGGDKQRSCVLWRITPDSDVPGYGIDGSSLGAAFAIALQQLLRRRPSSRLLSFATMRGFLARLRTSCVITGELSDERPAGHARQFTQRGPWLVSVGQMDAKLNAASAQRLRLVAPADNKPADGHEIPAGVHVYWASTLRQADRYARRIRPVRTAVTGFALLAAIGGSIGPALAVHYDNAAQVQHAQAERAQDIATANQLATEAEQVSAANPSLAAQLLLAAYRLDPQSQDLAWRLVSTESETLSAAENVGGTFDTLGGAVAFSPDGATLATVGDGRNAVILWSVGTAAGPRRLGQPLTIANSGSVDAVAFSPDGTILAAASVGNYGYGTVVLWEVSDPARPRRISQPLTIGTVGDPYSTLGYVYSLTFSPDGKTLAAAAGFTGGDNGVGTVTLWNVSDLARPRQLISQPLTAGGSDTVDTVAFSPDGQTLAVGASSPGNTVTLWSLSDPARPRRISPPLPIASGEGGGVYSLAFSPDGKHPRGRHRRRR